MLACERRDEVVERGRVGRAGEDEVVRQRPEGGGDGSAAVLDDQEIERLVDRGMVAQRARETEDEVVAGLVVEQERLREPEELLGGTKAPDTHPTMV